MTTAEIVARLYIIIDKEYTHDFSPSDPENDALGDYEERAYWMGYHDIQGFILKDLRDLAKELSTDK